MTSHDRLDMMEAEFKRVDDMFATGAMRAFGANSDRIFSELDEIRRKQIQLAIDHIGLQSVTDDEIPNDVKNEEDEYKKNAERFAGKEQDLNNLFNNLAELGDAMSRFHDLSNSVTNPLPTTFDSIRTQSSGTSTIPESRRSSIQASATATPLPSTKTPTGLRSPTGPSHASGWPSQFSGTRDKRGSVSGRADPKSSFEMKDVSGKGKGKAL